MESYSIEIRHEGLNKYRHIRGRDPRVVEQKAAAQLAAWDEAWARRQAIEGRRQAQEHNAQWAAAQTEEAQAAIEAIRNTLKHTLRVNDAINWDDLKDTSSFADPEPILIPPEAPPRQPLPADPQYRPALGLLDHLVPPLKARKMSDAASRYSRDLAQWQHRHHAWEDQARQEQAMHQQATTQWRKRRAAFLAAQKQKNEAVEAQRSAYWTGAPAAIEDYCDLVLSRSQYPDNFPQDFELHYTESTRTLVVDYILPAPEHLPKVKEVKYVKTRDAFQEVLLKESEVNALYDSLIYQIVLRSIHELLEADAIEALDAVAFNGWVQSIDPTTGNMASACIVSVHVTREEFMTINLANVDPRACFKKLKGVGSSELHSITPVAPLLKLDTEDRRFVPAHAVAARLSEGYNLAAMDWEDFEHLVREVFEKEFASAGGEVKVTRASRDGGVDAIAFDPDPIRGGKIVIQAKRYTNTVGVSAVRDLYGTVISEGASRGVLITTADYGPDAHNFAKDKPLTLLNGGNLLHLLQKHGHKAHIDLAEAKKQLHAERA